MVMDHSDAIDVPYFKGKIEFKNVWFAYNEGDWILKDVSFVIEPGQTANASNIKDNFQEI